MDRIDPTAGSARISFLYHYQQFIPAHLTAILRDQEIWCSDPSSMNDPWDFKPWFSCEPMLNDPQSLERMLEMFRANAGPEVINDPVRPLFEARIRQDPRELRKFVESFSKGLSQELCKRRVYCLTLLSDSILMWSHYTGNHKGLCLEFNVDNPLFSRARPVRYSHTYPEWTPHGMEENVSALILTKAVDWAYEREFRIVGTPNAALKGTPNSLDGNYLHLPPGALSAIIIGCEAPKDEITLLVREVAPGLPIKHAQRIPDKYKLEII
jgi:hypothetical protein